MTKPQPAELNRFEPKPVSHLQLKCAGARGRVFERIPTADVVPSLAVSRGDHRHTPSLSQGKRREDDSDIRTDEGGLQQYCRRELGNPIAGKPSEAGTGDRADDETENAPLENGLDGKRDETPTPYEPFFFEDVPPSRRPSAGSSFNPVL